MFASIDTIEWRAVNSSRGFGHRIESRGTERSTTQQPTKRQPTRTASAVDLERFVRIRRTRGSKAARRQPSLSHDLVPTDRSKRTATGPCLVRRHRVRHHRFARLSSRSSRERRSANESSTTGWRTPNNQSPGASSDSASNARSRRRIRLRVTALPMAREMANATQGVVIDGS